MHSYCLIQAIAVKLTMYSMAQLQTSAFLMAQISLKMLTVGFRWSIRSYPHQSYYFCTRSHLRLLIFRK